MSFLAKITIDGEFMNVLECSFAFKRGTDLNGRPAERAKGGQIRLLLESTGKTNFLDWLISDQITKSGTIVFTKRENIAPLKTIRFKDSYCLEYEEVFNSINDKPLQTHLVISTREFTIGETTYTNPWSDKIQDKEKDQETTQNP